MNKEMLKLVHSFLQESHLMKTARSLEQETGEVSCSNRIKYVMALIYIRSNFGLAI